MTTVDPILAQPDNDAEASKPFLKIRPRRGWIGVNPEELWRFRDLLWSLVGRDIKLRYKQTALGAAWVILQPLSTAAIFAFVFGFVAKMSGQVTTYGKPIPYFLYAYTGMVMWGLFANTVGKLSIILTNNASLVSKVYFPRLLLPISGAAGSLFDFFVAGAMLVVFQFMGHITPGPQVLLAPVVVLLFLALSIGMGMWAGALMVEYRDVAQVLPVALNCLLYASPIGYAAPHSYQYLYFLNPLAGLMGMWQWSVLCMAPPPLWTMIYAAIVSVMVLVVGTMVFRRKERMFADVI